MKIKKLISSLLATSTIAFSSPLAFAQWTDVDIGSKMINFEESGKKNWCWLSISLKLIDYWTTKYNNTEYYKQILKDIKNNDFKSFFDVFNAVLNTLKKKYPNDYHDFSSKSCLCCDADQVCNSIVAIRGVESFLNECYNKKFHSFEINFANKTLETLNEESEISLRKIGDLNAFDIASKIIDENKCPLSVALPIERRDQYSVQGMVEFLTLKARQLNLRFGICTFHNYLVSGIDSQSGKIRLINPTPRKSSERTIELSKDEFNKYCFILSGVLDKPFSL